MTPDEALGRAFEQARWDRRISQTHMANKMGIDQSTLSRKLHGERPWTFAEMLAAADALLMDLRELLGGMWGPTFGAAEDRAVNDGIVLPRSDSNRHAFDYKAKPSVATSPVTYLDVYRLTKAS